MNICNASGGAPVLANVVNKLAAVWSLLKKCATFGRSMLSDPLSLFLKISGHASSLYKDSSSAT